MIFATLDCPLGVTITGGIHRCGIFFIGTELINVISVFYTFSYQKITRTISAR